MNAVNSAILDASTGWIVLGAFSVLWIFLGWFWGRHSDELDDYVLAGRRVGLALGTATAMATWVTSNTTMAAPQIALQMGVWGMLGYSLGAVGLLMFAPLAGRIRRPDARRLYERRFCSPALWQDCLARVLADISLLQPRLARQYGHGRRCPDQRSDRHPLPLRDDSHSCYLRGLYVARRVPGCHRHRFYPGTPYSCRD